MRMLRKPALLASLVMLVPAIGFAATGPYVLSASAGYSEEGNDGNVDSSTVLTSVAISRQVDIWNYAGGLTYSRKDVDFVAPVPQQKVRSKTLGGFVSATGNLWQGGYVSFAGSYGENDNASNTIPFYDYDAKSTSFTTAVTQALPLGPEFLTSWTAAYTYSTFRPDNMSIGFTPSTTSQGLLSTGVRLTWVGTQYLPFVSVTHKRYRDDQIGNNDQTFYDLSAGASLPLENGRRLTLAVNNWVGLKDYERLGASLTYSHPLK